MNNFKKIFVFLTLSFNTFVISQAVAPGVPVDTSNPNSVELLASYNSPTASAFRNYIRYPSVTNNGAIDISVPIYSLSIGDLNHDIILSYNSKGIKVNSKASWVGTGWHLRAGGVITREVRDIPDDAFYYQSSVNPFISQRGKAYQYVIGWLHQNREFLTVGSRISDFPNTLLNPLLNKPYPSNPPNWNDERLVGHTLNELRSEGFVYDLEPDIYHFSLGHESFDFIFNENGIPKIIGLKDYKIEHEITNYPDYSYDSQINKEIETGEYPSKDFRNYLTRFIITNQKGVKYYFEFKDTEKTIRTDTNNSILSGTTKWSDKIKARVIVDGKLLLLKEKAPEYTSAWFLSKIVSAKGQEMNFEYYEENITDKPRIPVFLGGTMNPSDWNIDSLRTRFSSKISHMDRRAEYMVKSKFLKKISARDVEVKFNLGSYRMDSNGGKTLSSLEIKPIGHHAFEKSFEFSYYYRNADDCPDFALDEKWCKRLYLDNIKEVFSSSEQIIQYQFEYNKTNLPHRFSNEQDFWGYFNGNNATSLIPKLYAYPGNEGMNVYRIYSGGGNGWILPGANRDVVPHKAKAGSLQKIIFPTGGFRKYEFESNTFYDELSNKNQFGGGLRIKRIVHNDGSKNITKNYIYDTEVILDPENDDKVRSSGSVYAPPIYAIPTNFFQVPETINVDTMGFQAVMYCPSNESHISCDGENNPYEFPAYISDDYDIWNHFTKRSSHPYNKLTDSNGNSVLYTQVKEELEGSDGNGYSIHYFNEPETYAFHRTEVKKMFRNTTPPIINGIIVGGMPVGLGASGGMTLFRDDPIHKEVTNNAAWMYKAFLQRDGFGVLPYPPISRNVNDLGLYRGKKSRVVKFNSNNVMIQSVDYSYETFRNDNELVYGVVFKILDAMPSNNGSRRDIYNWAKYHHVVKTGSQLSQITTKKYGLENKTKSVTEVKKLHYENHPKNGLLSKVIDVKSNGKTITKKFYYPDDVTSATSLPGGALSDAEFKAIKQLKAQHRVSEVVQEVTEVTDTKGSVTVSKRNSYANWENKILPKSVQTRKGNTASSGFEDRVVYHRYDSHANPLEVSQKNGPHTVYLYGYTKQYPIAKIENATFKEVATALGISEDALEGFNENQIGQINGLRAKKPEWMITTYVHIPLVGVKTVTDPRGRRTNYEYDDFNRLRHIKDHNGDILEAYDYHYKSE